MRLFSVIQTSFDRFDDSVRSFLSKTFSSLGLEYTHSQIFGVIFDGVKGVMQNAMFYIEDALTEQNIFTALRRKSVYSIAKTGGYEAYYGAASSGTLLGTMHVAEGLTNKTTKVYLRDRSRVTDRSSGFTYSLILPSSYYVFDVSKPLVTHEFKIVQGTFASASYTASGVKLETVHVDSSDLFDRRYVTVKVDGEEWTEAACLYDMDDTSKQYVLSTGYDNTFDVMFGNGVHGVRLTEGQSVSVSYLHHAGSAGDVAPGASSDFVFLDYATDSMGDNVNPNDYMDLKVSVCISGGTDSDTVDFIRQVTGMNSRSLVLATEDNFRLFFRRFSFIGYSDCWSEDNSMTVSAVCLGTALKDVTDTDDYYTVDTASLPLSAGQKEMVRTTLENSKKAFAGVTLRFVDPVIRRFAAVCYVKTKDVYDREYVKAAVRKALATYFMGLDEGVTFIAKSDVTQAVLTACDRVTAFDMDFISEQAEDTFRDGRTYRYEYRYVNGAWEWTPVRFMYEEGTYPGLDSWGNIQLDSRIEVPVLHGGFACFPDRSDRTSSVTVEAVQVCFI